MTRLEQLRLDALLTRSELAVAAGVDRKTIARIEERSAVVQVTTLRKLVEYFASQGVEVTGSELLRDAATEAGAA